MATDIEKPLLNNEKLTLDTCKTHFGQWKTEIGKLKTNIEYWKEKKHCLLENL